MSEITPVTHTEKVVAGQVDAVTHFEKVIAKYGGGGGGGTSDYSQLSNKPKINNVELDGNKSLADIGAQPTIDGSHKVSADNIDDSTATNKFATVAQLEQIETNKNNISSFHKASGTDIYFQEDEPTGTIVQGSYWISRSGNKKYETSPNLSNGEFSQGGIYDNGGLNVLTNFVRISVPVTAGQTYSFSSNKLIRTVYGYQGRWDIPTSKTLILSDDTPSESSYTFTVPDNINNVGISLCNADSSAIVPSDVQSFMFNAGDTALPYEPYGVIWH